MLKPSQLQTKLRTLRLGGMLETLDLRLDQAQPGHLGYLVLVTKTARLLADLGGGRADGTWAVRLRRYLHPDVLILDDFGLKEFTPSQAEDIYELICERARAGSMGLTSNRS